MTRELAHKLRPVIFNMEAMEAITALAEHFISTAHTQMENCRPEEVQRLQGNIETARRLLRLRDDTLRVLEQR